MFQQDKPACNRAALVELPITDGSTLIASADANTKKTLNATSSSVTTAGTIAAGARSVTMQNIGVAGGTVQGGALAAGKSVMFAADNFEVLGEISYVATGTTFLITTLS